MSGASSNVAEWSTLLEPHQPGDFPRRPDDPRLGEFIECWDGKPDALKTDLAVLIGYPQDAGVRRNQGRPGAALAPNAIRHWLYRLSAWDAEDDVDLAESPPLDLGNIRMQGDLEDTQRALGRVVAEVLRRGSVPIVLGGGHETAYGHYLGYAGAGQSVGIINLDAHLDVRPLLDGLGHSGSPFRQCLEHAEFPLAGTAYACLGAQPHAVARAHWLYAREKGVVVRWVHEVRDTLSAAFHKEMDRLAGAQGRVYVSLDADVLHVAEMPGVSAPNKLGLSGAEVGQCVRLAGRSRAVSGLDLVEINPNLDRDDQSALLGALLIWNFLVGLRLRALV